MMHLVVKSRAGDGSRVFEEEGGGLLLFNVGAFPIQEGQQRQPSSRLQAMINQIDGLIIDFNVIEKQA
jgi:hypothetical protein